LPVVHSELVEKRDWRDSSVVDENVQLAVSLNCQPDKVGDVLPPLDVCACVDRLAARCCDASSDSVQAIRPTRFQYDLCAALSEQERSRLPNATACTRNYDNLVFDSQHEVFLSSLCPFAGSPFF